MLVHDSIHEIGMAPLLLLSMLTSQPLLEHSSERLSGAETRGIAITVAPQEGSNGSYVPATDVRRVSLNQYVVRGARIGAIAGSALGGGVYAIAEPEGYGCNAHRCQVQRFAMITLPAWTGGFLGAGIGGLTYVIGVSRREEPRARRLQLRAASRSAQPSRITGRSPAPPCWPHIAGCSSISHRAVASHSQIRNAHV
jgi:hypothetical protein